MVPVKSQTSNHTLPSGIRPVKRLYFASSHTAAVVSGFRLLGAGALTNNFFYLIDLFP